MTLSQCITWLQEASTMLGTIGQIEENIARSKAGLELSEAVGNSNQIMSLSKQLSELNALRSKMIPVVLERVKVHDLDAVNQFLADIQHKINQTEERFQHWRRGVTSFELALKLDESLQDGEARANAESQLAALKQRYEAALELTSDSIPSSVRLVHV